MDNCQIPETHLYALSFTVGSESGIALVAAGSASQAFQILKDSGSRNCHDGNHYVLIDNRDIGMVCNCHYGLLMESFVNALQAYDAIMSAANRLIGPKGDTGEKGEKGDISYLMFSLNDNGELIYEWANADNVADFALDNNGNLCVVM